MPPSSSASASAACSFSATAGPRLLRALPERYAFKHNVLLRSSRFYSPTFGINHVAFRTAAAGTHKRQQARPAEYRRNRQHGVHRAGTTSADGLKLHLVVRKRAGRVSTDGDLGELGRFPS